MKLYVCNAIGRGATAAAAFDAATVEAGIARFNIVRLHSSVPEGAEVQPAARYPFEHQGRWGDRLYASYAATTAIRPGQQVWAGLAWSQQPGTGRGLIVGHHSDRRQSLLENLHAAVEDLFAVRRLDLGTVHTSIVGAMCVGAPTCALVVCCYQLVAWADWSQPPDPRDDRLE